MKRLLLALIAFFLAACQSPPRRWFFDDSSPRTIQVFAGYGFEKLGVHYLPKGATVGDLIDRAILAEYVTKLRHGAPGDFPVPCALEDRRGRRKAETKSYSDVQTPRFRNLRLSEGDRLEFVYLIF